MKFFGLVGRLFLAALGYLFGVWICTILGLIFIGDITGDYLFVLILFPLIPAVICFNLKRLLAILNNKLILETPDTETKSDEQQNGDEKEGCEPQSGAKAIDDLSTVDAIASERPKVPLHLFSKEKELMDWQADLEKREAALTDRENRLKERARKLKDDVAESISASMKQERIDLRLKKDEIETEISRLQEYKAAVERTEYRVYDWVRRRERDDNEAFAELVAEAKKYTDNLENFKDMDGFKFEEHVAGILRGKGYADVEVTQKSADFGADIVASLGGAKYVIQCKYYSSPVGVEAVQQVFAAKRHYRAHVAAVATNNVFTKAAKILAEENGVILWDCEALESMKQ